MPQRRHLPQAPGYQVSCPQRASVIRCGWVCFHVTLAGQGWVMAESYKARVSAPLGQPRPLSRAAVSGRWGLEMTPGQTPVSMWRQSGEAQLLPVLPVGTPTLYPLPQPYFCLRLEVVGGWRGGALGKGSSGKYVLGRGEEASGRGGPGCKEGPPMDGSQPPQCLWSRGHWALAPCSALRLWPWRLG